MAVALPFRISINFASHFTKSYFKKLQSNAIYSEDATDRKTRIYNMQRLGDARPHL